MAAKSCANSDQKMVDDAASLISTEVDWMLDDVTVECIAEDSVEVVHDIYQPAVDDVLELNGKDHIGSCYEEVQQLRVDDSHGAHTSKHCDAIANDLEMCQDRCAAFTDDFIVIDEPEDDWFRCAEDQYAIADDISDDARVHAAEAPDVCSLFRSLFSHTLRFAIKIFVLSFL